MTMLPDFEIERLAFQDALIAPYDSDFVQPCSYDVRLGSQVKIMRAEGGVIDPNNPATVRFALIEMSDNEDIEYRIEPGMFLLASTYERVKLPDGIAARIEGKSSLGRIGLAVHITAGFIDPGFEGHITLEMANVGPRPIRIRPGMKIAQLAFQYLNYPAKRPYGHPDLGSKYQGQGALPQEAK